jgi:SAM-dependent methyltransferase
MKEDFDTLVEEAKRQPFSGWDFTYLFGRFVETKPSWDYFAIVRERMKGIKSMLDLGTGGGERLSSLQPFPAKTYATEGYPPNALIARERLGPLGVKVVKAQEGGDLPFEDGSFELIIDRHTGYDPKEVSRTLKPGGLFITQQIGWLNNDEIHEFFQVEKQAHPWTFEKDVNDLKNAGFRILVTRAESQRSAFHDVGTLVYYLKAIPWEVPGFSVKKYKSKLSEIHAIIQKDGKFQVTTSRYIIEAEKN